MNIVPTKPLNAQVHLEIKAFLDQLVSLVQEGYLDQQVKLDLQDHQGSLVPLENLVI